MKKSYSEKSLYCFLSQLEGKKGLFLTSVLMLLFSAMVPQVLLAQKAEKRPAVPVICPAKQQDMFTKVNIPDHKGEHQRMLQDAATAEFDITFGPGAQANPEASAAFEYALEIWGTQIVSPVPIKIYADFAALGPGVLASAGPAYNVINFPNAPEQDVLYPAALANALAGEVLFPDEQYDLIVNLGDGIPWYFGTDGNTPSGFYDFVTVALHEAGHGLGFTTVRAYNNGSGSLRSNGNPAIFGVYIEDGDGTRLLTYADPSTELGDAFTGGNIFMGGTFAVAALGGQRPELYAPSNWQGGSSIAHWDEAAFPAGNVNSLMTPQVGSAEANYDIGDITRGLFKDMGWIINDEEAPAITANPNSISEVITVGETLTTIIRLSNISDSVSTVTLSTSTGSAVIESIDPGMLSIPSAETDSFTVKLNATGLDKGIYEDIIIVASAETADTIRIPVYVQVLDGTEAPEISVSPLSLEETLEQFQTSIQTLTISNTGDADLSFSIIIEDDSTNNFEDNVVAYSNYISAEGFISEQYPPMAETSANSSSLITGGISSYNRAVTTLFATDFEDYPLGNINNVEGWISQYPGNWVFSNANPDEGDKHLRSLSDGLGSTRSGNILAISPSITPLDDPFMTLTASVNITGSGVTWEVIPQSPTEESVVTRLRFNPDRSIEVLAGSGFTPIEATTPEGYFDLRIVVDKDDATFSVYFDEELIFSGQGFASIMEQVVFLSNMEVEGPTLDIDNMEITDGDAEATFVSVSPNSGTVPFGSSTTVNVKFDARAMDPGEYNATLLVNSNDPDNATVEVPVNLTVVSPPTIEVSPDSLSAAVNVQTDNPATKTETFTISNTGESTLQFSASAGASVFTPFSNEASNISFESLDMALYGEGNTGSFTEKLANAPKRLEAREFASSTENASNYSDSIAYDSGLDFPDDFAGVQTAAYTSAVNFDVESEFTLTAVRNGYRTEAAANPVVVLEIYKGGATPNEGELLLTQTFNQASEEGVVVVEILNESLNFSAGESFWVVHKYPDGIAFPQGVDSDATQRPDTYFFSGDGGASFNPSGFVFFVRALSGGSEGNYISLSPSSGSVAPGESVEVSVTFDGSELANGMYDTDIVINSNDPVTPSATVATHFEVTGQVSEIFISDEYLLFNDVFLGAERERTFTINNEGLSTLNITDISSDNPDFTVNTSSATINAGASLEVAVNFAPSQAGNVNGIITIESDASNNPVLEVVVNGVGVEPPIAVLDPQEVSETTEAGTTVQTEITLRNDGNAPLIYSFPELTAMLALSNPEVQLNNTEILSFSNVSGLEEKGANDNRVGSEVLYSVGTDNEYGYSWIDSNEPGGPVYSFNDITASGTEITTTLGGDGTAAIELPFSFEFYGENYSNAYINANGFIAFQEPTGANTWTNSQIPTDGVVNNMIAGFWNDIEPQNFNGSVHYADMGDQFIVQWTNAALYLGSDDETVTFQIVLHQEGHIDVYYEDVESASFLNSATVGIENGDGTDGAQVAFNTDYVADGLALRFIKPNMTFTSFISNISSATGVVPAGGSKTLTVTLDATDLNDGIYYDELIVSSNAPSDSASTALFELTVIGFPEIQITPDSIHFDSLFVGLTTEGSFLIENVGSKDLEISSISNGNADFTLDETGPMTLAPNQSRIVNVEFTPSSVGFIDDQVTIESNDEFDNETAVVYLSGYGIDPPVISVSPDSLSLVVYKGDSTVENISISNTGGSVLNYALTPPYFARAQAANHEGLQYEQLEFDKILSKEELDTRVGPEFLNASGGPGTFGYTWVDNNTGGPAYDYIDISETGEMANVGGDGNEQVALPFSFNFFGNAEDSVTIGANGFLTFAPLSGNNYVNQQIPDPANPNLFIAAMWDDLEPQDGGGVFYQATDDYFIVQYDSVPGWGFFTEPPAPVSFQVILFPNGTIKMQYQDVESSTIPSTSTVGLEGPQGLSGLQVIFNNDYLTNGLAITFTPPLRGTVAPGETVEVPITFYSEGLEAGETYNGDIKISSNDPANPEVTVPVELEVLEVPEIVSFTLVNAELNEEIGELEEGEIINLDNYASNSFSVLAIPSTEKVGSVVFDFNDAAGIQVENIAPYALAGDSNNGTSFYAVEFPLGINTVTATPYTGKNGTGVAGQSLTVSFEVITNQTDFCYAGSVVSYMPGNRKNGRSLPPSRSNPERALGEPQENNNYNFVALGFGGSITIELACEVMDHEGNDLMIVETSFRDINKTCENYPEKARIEASEDGENWVVLAEEICRDGEVDLADGGLSRASYVRITDVSNPNDFSGANADGYDLDGIIVINNFADTTQTEMVQQVAEQANIVANEESVDIVAYPNPVTDYVQFNLKGEGNVFYSKLYNMRGELVDHSEFSLQSGEDRGQLNMSKLSRGIYHLRLTNAEGGIVSQVKILKN